MRVLNRENLLDIISGATLLGSGGGGSPKDGLSLVEKIFSASTGVELASPDEVCDSDYIAMIAGIGSPKALREKGSSDIHQDFIIPKPTLTLDGKIVIQDGELLI